MTIIYVIDSLALAGAQKHLVQLATGLAKNGHHGVVFCLNEIAHPRRVAELEAAGLEVRILGKVRVLSGLAVLDIASKSSREKAAVVVTVLFVSTIVGRAAAWVAGVPQITCIQASTAYHPFWKRILLRITSRISCCCISNSISAAEYAWRHEGMPAEHCHFIPNGIEVGEPVPHSGWSGLGLAQLEGRLVIASIGRLSRQKGQDILIAAIALIAPRFPKISLLLIGRGKPERLKRQARAAEIEDRVVFAGERSDIDILLAGSTLYVQSSRFEGMPNALMEAMAAGLPVVATPVDGVSDLITNFGNGWLTESDCPHSLAETIATALVDPIASAQIGRNARKTMAEKFMPNVLLERYGSLFLLYGRKHSAVVERHSSVKAP